MTAGRAPLVAPRTVAAEAFAKMVAERTNGEVAINIAGSEQLGNDVSMLTSMRTGALDLTANSQGAASGLVPEIAALGLPFIFKDAAQAHQVLEGPIGLALVEKFTAVGLIPLDWWDNGIRHTTNSKKSIEMPADFSGMNIRTPADPVTVDIFQALGAATQQIPFGELYIALQQGVVDGQENPLANIASAKIVGMPLDLPPAILLLGPIFVPLAATIGVDPVQLGLIMILNLGIGLYTPPIGTTLFISSSIAKTTLAETTKELWPFFAVAMLLLIAITYIPALTIY